MALVIADRVKETSTTTGTGTLTLGGAATGYQTFSAAIGSGNTCYYAITLDSDWEVGIGTVGTGTLSRDSVLASSNSNSLVNFGAGTKDVFVTHPASAIASLVSGPASVIAGRIATFDGTSGKAIQDSGKSLPSGTVVGTTDAQTLTGKTIAYADNTLTGVQPTLVSGTTIKTINSVSVLGSGDIATGDVVGPASATDNAVALFDGATGKLLKNGSVLPTFPSGTIVGTTDTQTLTNKTLTDPKISLSGTNGTAGQVPVSQGAGLPPVWGDVSGGADIQEFSTSGTWTKPSGASFLLVELWGGGGGGGGGARGTSATGGSGGGGGGSIVRFYKASALPSSVTVTIGAGGSGGASVTTNSAGNDGSSGGVTSFGVLAYADGGTGGRGGNASTTDTATTGGGGFPTGSSANTAPGWGEGGPYGAGSIALPAESGGGNGGPGRSTAAGSSGGPSSKGGPGGGGGGGVATSAAVDGGAGGAIREGNGTTLLVGGGGGTAPGGAGASGSSDGSSIYRVAGSGGGGGAGSLTTAAGAGGNGGRAAGGGGGGGASGFPSGAGGAGGNGYARITAW